MRLGFTNVCSFIGCSVSGKVKGMVRPDKVAFEFSVGGKLNCMRIDGACAGSRDQC